MIDEDDEVMTVDDEASEAEPVKKKKAHKQDGPNKPSAKPKAKLQAKAKPQTKAKAKPKEGAKYDQFGLRAGTVRSQAAALYAREGGATLNEVKNQLGTIQFNVLTTLKKLGHDVSSKKEAGSQNRVVTRYFLTCKDN